MCRFVSCLTRNMSGDGAHFALFYDGDNKRHVLLHKVLGLESKLDTDGMWDLAQKAPENRAFLYQRETKKSCWCVDSFDYIYHCHGESEIVIDKKNKRSFGMIEWLQQHVSITINIPWAWSAAENNFMAAVLKSKMDGVKVLWALKSWHGACVGSKEGNPSAWYRNWWKWWEKAFSKISLSHRHLRKAAPTGHHRTDDCDASVRFLSDATVSTYGLLALFARFCKQIKGGKDKKVDSVQAWKIGLKSLCDNYFGGGLVFPVTL